MVRFSLFTLALVAAAPLAAQAGGATSVTRAKIAANAEAEFARVDTNKDGQMSRAEIETFQRAAAIRIIADRNKAIFTALDADKNGQISAAEFTKLSNNNPKIDVSNVLKIDSNKDGQISLAEHRGAMLETFNQADTNKDGILTAAEAQAKVSATR